MKYKLAEMKIFWATRLNPGGVLEELKTGSLVTTKNNCLNGFRMTGEIPEDRILYIDRHTLARDLTSGIVMSSPNRRRQKQACNECKNFIGGQESFCLSTEEYIFDKINFGSKDRHGFDLLQAKHRDEIENHKYLGEIFPLCCCKHSREKILFLGPVKQETDFRLMVDKTDHQAIAGARKGNPIGTCEEVALGKFLTPNKQLIYLHSEQIKKLEIVNAE